MKKVEKQAGHDRLALLGDAGRGPLQSALTLMNILTKVNFRKLKKDLILLLNTMKLKKQISYIKK